MTDYVAKANQYIADVLAGKIPACRAGVVNACRRQQKDLRRQRSADFPYYFDPESGLLHTGWLELPDGKYFLNSNGNPIIGLFPCPQGSYYFAEDGKMAIVQNGSPLFSGDAGSGPSEIRRYMLENDWLEAIIQLSTDQFMNTGIATYIWVLSKDKPAYRAGKVQLIDASKMVVARRKNLGSKRNDITDADREVIVKAYGEFENAIYECDGKICESKIFNNEEFGFNRIQIESPLYEDGVIVTKGKKNAFVADFIGESNIIEGVMRADFWVEMAGHKFKCLDKGFGVDEKVDVVVRPEDVDVVPVEKAMISGVVTSITFKGLNYDIIVDFRGFKWLIQTTDFHAVDSTIGIRLNPEDIHIMHKSEYSGLFGDYSSYSAEYDELTEDAEDEEE